MNTNMTAKQLQHKIQSEVEKSNVHARHEKARLIDKKIKEQVNVVKTVHLKIGQYLLIIRDEGLYRCLGFSSMTAYINKLGLNQGAASVDMRAAEVGSKASAEGKKRIESFQMSQLRNVAMLALKRRSLDLSEKEADSIIEQSSAQTLTTISVKVSTHKRLHALCKKHGFSCDEAVNFLLDLADAAEGK